MKKQTLALIIAGTIISQLIIPTTGVVAVDNTENTNMDYNNDGILPRNIIRPKIAILAKDKTIKVGDRFNPRDGVTVKYGRNDITEKLKVKENTVNTNKAGIYKVVYEVTHEYVTKTHTISVTVKSNSKPVISGINNITILQGTMFNPMDKVTATDVEDGNITTKIKVTGSVDINNPGKYYLKYSVTDSHGNVTTVTRIITVNNIPVINAIDKVIKVGDTFDPLEGVTARDVEDGDITNNIKVIENTVDTQKPGTYKVVYEVADRHGANGIKTISITVKSNSKPVISGINNITILQGTMFNPMDKVTATDVEDGNITTKIKVTGSVDINKPGKYYLKYSVTDSHGNVTTVTRIITVNNIPVINAIDKVIEVGDTFDPLEGVTASDVEDGDITNNIKVIENTVDTQKPGTYKVVYEVADSHGVKGIKTISVTVEKVVKENEATAKLAYFKSYGIVLEGSISGDEKYDDTVKKSLVIKGKDGTVKLKKDIVNTNWYDDGYSGFQAIITTKDISDIGEVQDAKLEIEVNNNGTIRSYDFKAFTISEDGSKPTPPNVDSIVKPEADIGWTSEYYYVQDLPKVEFGSNIVQLAVGDDNLIYLTNKIKDFSFDIMSYYKTDKGEYVLDTIVKFKNFDMNDAKNIFEVKDKDGQVVHIGNVATFKEGIFENAAPKSALQVVIPQQYSNDSYSFEIIVKDKNDVERARFKAPKFS